MCMISTYSQNDTQDLLKSCVSFFVIDMFIHKSYASADYMACRTVKNVYETQRTDDPYTTSLASAARQARRLCTTGPASVAEKAHILYKTGLLFCPGSASAVGGPLSQPVRQHLSEELRRRRSMLPTLRQRREVGRKHYRAARPAGRPRELRGERTGMYF